jgi:hypothetical protein
MTFEQSREMAKAMDKGRAAIMAASRRGEITVDDVAILRREIFIDGFVSRDEADALFALERSTVRKCADWTAFFVEAITDHVVWQTRPTGVVNEAQGEWLIARADEVASLNGLAVLVNVMAEAHRVPLWFLAAVRSRAARGWTGVAEAKAEALANVA